MLGYDISQICAFEPAEGNLWPSLNAGAQDVSVSRTHVDLGILLRQVIGVGGGIG
ncbi:hypothetical protein, partial [Cupriavidus sp. CuC1]|uniref:hypothetical protein n=1 Tax=Cupriavidus sp. CuC1 TaxID=3373131 RepID=UPI0037D93A04